MNDIKIKLDRLHHILDKKLEILDQIYNITENQEMFFTQLEGEEKKYFLNESLKEKQNLIKKLSKLDDEFILIFNSFDGKLNSNKDYFSENINCMKDKIKSITDLDVKIRIKEEKNNLLILSSNQENKINIPKVSKVYLLNKYKENSTKHNKF